MAVILALALLTAPITGGSDVLAASSSSSSCSDYDSRTVPPSTIRVFRLHRKGSSVPRRVERYSFKDYVGLVMNSGAWPSRPRASAIVGAIAIKQWAWWMVLHHQPGYSLNGQCYDVTDSDQYLAPWVRPWSRVNTRTQEVVHDTWGISLRKGGRLFRSGWSGERCRDGWHLCEDSVRDLAHGGWDWRRILRWALSPNLTIRGGLR